MNELSIYGLVRQENLRASTSVKYSSKLIPHVSNTEQTATHIQKNMHDEEVTSSSVVPGRLGKMPHRSLITKLTGILFQEESGKFLPSLPLRKLGTKSLPVVLNFT